MMTPNYLHKQIFSKEPEHNLTEYLKKISKMFYGLTPNQVKELAYDMAKKKFNESTHFMG